MSKLFRPVFLSCGLMLLFVGVALAQAVGDTVVTPAELATQAEKVANDWQLLGWQGGTAALVGFLILLLRFKKIDDYLEASELKKYKPYIAGVLGGLAGFFSSFMSGVSVPQSIIAGVFAGAAAVGVHQAVTLTNQKVPQAEIKEGGAK